MARQAQAERNQAHQLGQAALVAVVARAVAEAWVRLFDVHDLRGSSRRLTVAVDAIVQHYGRASSSAALTHFRNERRAQGVTGPVPRLRPSTAPDTASIAARVEKVLHPLYGAVDEAAVQNAQDALASEAEQMVLDQSRNTIIDAVQQDTEARAWARVTEAGACSECRLYATRGAVYKTEASADFRAHVKKADGSGGTCRCHVEPAFGVYEMTAQARQDLADYRDLTKEYGKSGRALHIAWRQHVEGREVTGPLTKPYTHGGGDGHRKRADEGRGNHVGDTSSLGFDKLDRAQLEHQLSVLEGLKDSDYKRSQIARVRKRLADLS